MDDLNTDQPQFRDPVSRMSHELRTPMTSIIGFSELLLEDETITGTPREYLAVISAEARRLSEMLNEFTAELRRDQCDSMTDPIDLTECLLYD